MGMLLSCCDPNRDGEDSGSGDRSRLINDDAYSPAVSSSANHDTSGSSGGIKGASNGPGSTAPDGNGSVVCANSVASGMKTVIEQRKKDEGQAFQFIVEKMSKRFIDMEGQNGPLVAPASQASTVEPPFVQERAKEYGKRLQKAAHAIVLNHAQDPSSKMVDVQANLDQAILGQVISDSDAMLVSEIAARAQEAVMEFKPELLQDLVVPLGVQAVESDPR